MYYTPSIFVVDVDTVTMIISQQMIFLDLLYDTVATTVQVPQDKLDSITELIKDWLTKLSATKAELQSLIGKLAFVCACISPSPIFMQH